MIRSFYLFIFLRKKRNKFKKEKKMFYFVVIWKKLRRRNKQKKFAFFWFLESVTIAFLALILILCIFCHFAIQIHFEYDIQWCDLKIEKISVTLVSVKTIINIEWEKEMKSDEEHEMVFYFVFFVYCFVFMSIEPWKPNRWSHCTNIYYCEKVSCYAVVLLLLLLFSALVDAQFTDAKDS